MSLDLSSITNDTVTNAVKALQNKDKKAWKKQFVEHPVFTDDGNPRDFNKFCEDAVGEEWFTRLHKVEENGTHVYGHLHTVKWGDFDVYFNFYVKEDELIDRLDIGQVSKLKK